MVPDSQGEAFVCMNKCLVRATIGRKSAEVGHTPMWHLTRISVAWRCVALFYKDGSMTSPRARRWVSWSLAIALSCWRLFWMTATLPGIARIKAGHATALGLRAPLTGTGRTASSLCHETRYAGRVTSCGCVWRGGVQVSAESKTGRTLIQKVLS